MLLGLWSPFTFKASNDQLSLSQWMTLWPPSSTLNREDNGTPLQYSCLENPMDGGAWWAAVHGVAKSWTRLSDFTFTFHFHILEKEMATHSSIPAWRIPWMEEPDRLQSMGSQRVRHDWVTSLSFPRLLGWILSSFCFLPSQVGPVVCVSFL